MYKITEIHAAGGGERLLLKILSPDGSSETVTLGCGEYRRLGIKKGEIDEELYKRLVRSAQMDDALRRGVRILGYGINSPKRLEDKLVSSGVSRETAKLAARELCRRGYIDEEDDAWRLAEGMIKKGYGKRKILSSLREKRFSSTALEAVCQRLDEVDFFEVCREAARKKFKHLEPAPNELQRAVSKLIAQGFSLSEAKSAVTEMAKAARNSEQ